MKELLLGANLERQDLRTIKLKAYLHEKTGTIIPPSNIDWDIRSKDAYQMWKNDVCGDCTVAAMYNMFSGSAADTKKVFTATDEMVISDYSAISGYNPNTGENDNGANPEDVLKYFSKKPEEDPSRIIAWGKVDNSNVAEIQKALFLFGGIYTGWALPLTAQDEVGDIWDESPLGTTGRVPGSWGGHMTITRHIESDWNNGIYTITWGKSQQVTRRFWDKYCFVTYFFITKNWISNISNKTLSGFDLDTLLKDINELKSS
jgi:hypothetical protein